jgi:co-chaperonin GroES (HSP10)
MLPVPNRFDGANETGAQRHFGGSHERRRRLALVPWPPVDHYSEAARHTLRFANSDGIGGYRVRVLRGRVVVREHKEESVTLWTPEGDPRVKLTHRGTVLGVGPGAYTKKGVEVDIGVSVGDVVQFHFEGTERGRIAPWTDGEPALYLAQREVDAVIE